MITDRTLLAYEQFCENYYEDYSVSSRAWDVHKRQPWEKYFTSVAWTRRPDDYDRDKRLQHVGLAIKDGKINADVRDIPLAQDGYGLKVGYRISDKKADRIRMKRDPKFRAEKLAEINARKEKNRAAHELGQQRQKERAERKANPKKQSFISQVIQAHKKHGKIIADNVRMMKDGITSK